MVLLVVSLGFFMTLLDLKVWQSSAML